MCIRDRSKSDSFENIDLEKYSELLLKNIDDEFGGFKGAPKFMMPNNLQYLLRYSFQESNENSKNKILSTLDKMAYGGIYDHIEGGFSRYSTDERWHIPHFEKMLYDNGQLMSLYSIGYQISGKNLYKDIGPREKPSGIEENLTYGFGFNLSLIHI